jgi:curved DNA-binding protein CbpA
MICSYMNWFLKLALKLTLDEALAIFGLQYGASADEVNKTYRRLAMQHHTDRGGSDAAMSRINTAYEILQKGTDQGSGSFSYEDFSGFEETHRRSAGIPEWQTDKRSTYNEVGRDFRNLNFCKKAIYDKAKESGDVEEYTFWAFDGSYFRGVFSAFCNEQTLGFAGKAMEQWNSHGGNSYPTIAVFAKAEGSNTLKLIQLGGADVSGENRTYEDESFNGNPGNDQSFVNRLRQEFSTIGKNVDVTA